MTTTYFLNGYLVCGIFFLYFVWFLTDPEPKPMSGYLKLWFAKDPTYTGVFLVAHSLLQLLAGILFSWPSTPANALFQSFGVVLFTGAVALASWAKFTMRENWGRPAQHDVEKQRKLVTWGPFRYTRNPIYLGLALIPFGAGLALRSLLLPLVFLFWLHLRRMASGEEQLLEKYFGREYEVYKRRTPRFL